MSHRSLHAFFTESVQKLCKELWLTLLQLDTTSPSLCYVYWPQHKNWTRHKWPFVSIGLLFFKAWNAFYHCYIQQRKCLWLNNAFIYMIVIKPKFDSLLKRFYLVLDCSGAYTVGLSRYQPRCLGSPHHIEARQLKN